MLNINQNNEIENINKEISLLQDRLEINEKSLNQFKNRLMQIKRIQGQRTNLSKAEKIYLKISKDIFKNKIKHIKKGWSTKKCTCKCKKRKRLSEKGLMKVR